MFIKKCIINNKILELESSDFTLPSSFVSNKGRLSSFDSIKKHSSIFYVD